MTDFSNRIDPISQAQLAGSEHLSTTPTDKDLLQTTSEIARFFSFLVGYPRSSQQAFALQSLSQVIRILQCHRSGGAFLSKDAEGTALDSLKGLLEDLDDGQLRLDNLPGSLDAIAGNMCLNNPKAQLVFQLTKLEYLLLISPITSIDPSQQQQLHLHFEEVIQKIQPALLDIKAKELTRALHCTIDILHLQSMQKTRTLADQALTQKTITDLNKAVENWLTDKLK